MGARSGGIPAFGTSGGCGEMSPIKASPWMAYFVVYVAGFAGLMYLTRVASDGSPVLILPFVFPVVLIVIAALAARAAAGSESGSKDESPSRLGRSVTFRREPMRWTTAVALMLFAPFYLYVYPTNVGTSQFRLVFTLWWLFLAGFTGFLLPRLLKLTRV
jgi:hypothetical protein